MRAGVAYALSFGVLSLLFLAGFLLMLFPKNKTLVGLGLFIAVIALFIAAPIVYLLVQKYGLSLVAT
jgi:hypothetical protein